LLGKKRRKPTRSIDILKPGRNQKKLYRVLCVSVGRKILGEATPDVAEFKKGKGGLQCGET